ncbi:hypothetical protein [Streptomyces sp. HUAS TT20]|uniref:hypothetical protein n=1 Tax=Streptomyces sp. HUAS TT20 TaxID=3447509 RepID=UPI002955B01A|nr:hypothetical protein [Streptomyces sp. HUAS 15-9]
MAGERRLERGGLHQLGAAPTLAVHVDDAALEDRPGMALQVLHLQHPQPAVHDLVERQIDSLFGVGVRAEMQVGVAHVVGARLLAETPVRQLRDHVPLVDRQVPLISGADCDGIEDLVTQNVDWAARCCGSLRTGGASNAVRRRATRHR